MSIRETICNYLTKHPNATRAEIQKGTGLKEKVVRYCVFALAQNGILKSKKTNQKSKNGRRFVGFTVAGAEKPKAKKARKVKLVKVEANPEVVAPVKKDSVQLSLAIPIGLHNKMFDIINLYSTPDKSVTIPKFVCAALESYIDKVKENIKNEVPLCGIGK
jgi:hypothetical protein